MKNPAREAVRTRYIEQDGRLYARSWQNGARELLADNLRRQSLPTRKSDFAEPLARIPDIVREHWRRQGREDLLRGDVKALNRYLNSTEGRLLRTSPRGKSRAFSKGGI